MVQLSSLGCTRGGTSQGSGGGVANESAAEVVRLQ